ncbi:MAG: hypothetical protein ACYC1M_18945 [Armatimonadota bacterium]
MTKYARITMVVLAALALTASNMMPCRAADNAPAATGANHDNRLPMGPYVATDIAPSLLVAAETEIPLPATLSAAIQDFNRKAAADPVGKNQPELTEDELLAFIQWMIKNPVPKMLSSAENATLEKIAMSRTMADDTFLEVLTSYENNGMAFTVWSVRLVIPNQHGTHAIPIREQFIRCRWLTPEEIKRRENGRIGTIEAIPNIAPNVSAPAAASPTDQAADGAYTEIQGPLLAINNQIRLLSSQFNKLQSELKFLTAQQHLSLRYRETAKRRESLSPKHQVLPQLNVDMKQLREQISERTANLAAARRLIALAEPVDIVLKSARIRQVAEALSKVTSLKITVDANVPNDISVKTEAREIPLGAVLEVIASAAHLTISPGADGGLILMSPGKKSERTQQIYQGPNTPWSKEWVMMDDGSLIRPVGRRWLNLYGAMRVQPPMPTVVPTIER